MREIKASEAKTQFLSLLDDVERGETVIVTRHGKPIARIVPEREVKQAHVERVFADLADLGKKAPNLTLDELLSARHEGHRF